MFWKKEEKAKYNEMHLSYFFFSSGKSSGNTQLSQMWFLQPANIKSITFSLLFSVCAKPLLMANDEILIRSMTALN